MNTTNIQNIKRDANVGWEALLLKGPVATEKQIAVIENNRKAINQWRTK